MNLLHYEREKSCVVGTFLGEKDVVNRTVSKPEASGKKLATTTTYKGDSTARKGKDIRSFLVTETDVCFLLNNVLNFYISYGYLEN